MLKQFINHICEKWLLYFSLFKLKIGGTQPTPHLLKLKQNYKLQLSMHNCPCRRKYLLLKTFQGFVQFLLWSIDNVTCFEISPLHFISKYELNFLSWIIGCQNKGLMHRVRIIKSNSFCPGTWITDKKKKKSL